MAPAAAAAAADRGAQDDLATALLAAELDERGTEPVNVAAEVLDQLFRAIPQLRASVPFATLCLLAKLSRHKRADVRATVARALPWFVDLYPARTEAVLAQLVDDLARKVRDAAGETLAELLQGAPDPLAAVERWRLRARSSRAQETLAAACMRLPVFAAP